MSHAGERLDALAAAIRNCRKCGLAKQRRHAVAGEGNPRARLIFIG
ncbi:MAG TPA: uracil-DNA glycosylase, partial [Desulfobulbus sp.]|nr:uracil-DNA glycosylase [Desulfobulbus sp.]